MTYLLDRLRDREIVRTNPIGAERTFPVGAIVPHPHNGTLCRVTRHKKIPGSQWGTIIVYGVPA